MRESSRTPDDYLGAALHIFAEEAAPKLTLGQVAEAAGVSKGGLLHHYPSKDALLQALLEREYTRFKASVEQRISGDMPGTRTRALITACFEAEASGQNLMRSLLAAAFESSELLATFRAE